MKGTARKTSGRNIDKTAIAVAAASRIGQLRAGLDVNG
jgi:hypothetical protein